MQRFKWLGLGASILCLLHLAGACGNAGPSEPSGVAGGGGNGLGGGPMGTVGGTASGGSGIIIFPVAGMSSGAAAGCSGDECNVLPEYCGDGRLNPEEEECDDGGNTSSEGCSADCKLEKDYACPIPGQPCVSTVACGDEKITGSETCDDGNTASGDGCGASCQLEAGWACPITGARCVAADCGDGMVAGFETCDDNNAAASDGCSDTCQLELGFKCEGTVCTPTICADGTREGAEQCDDGNFDTGDGCSPLCTFEPKCTDGVCEAICGDGIKMPSEECDDGNLRAFDGCSDQCKIEPGFYCSVLVQPPVLPIVYRDFIGTSGTGSNSAVNGNDAAYTHRDFEKYNGCEEDVQDSLDNQGKPVLLNRDSPSRSSGNCIESAETFAQWYRSDNLVNRTVVDTITLLPLDTNDPNPTVFEYFNTQFFPLDGRGFNDAGDLKEGSRSNGHNFHFTSELRYWFTYAGGEKLTFYGDDDVWVFINKKLAVDIAGVHGKRERSITLGAQASMMGSTSGSNKTFGYFDSTALGLTVGGVYEVVVFQAERHTTASQYKLTLENFFNARSVCQSTCGDGVVASNEACDDGQNNDGRYNGCTAQCTLAPRCGDHVVQAEAGEACDDGMNTTAYSNSPSSNACAPQCKKPSHCGDGAVDSLFGEQCDNSANDGSYGTCASNCRLAPRCGDGILQPEFEQCDEGSNNQIGGACNRFCRRQNIK